MQRHINTILLLTGIVAIVVMMLAFKVSITALFEFIQMAGYWFMAVVLLWGVLYGMSTLALRTIIRSSGSCPVGFWRTWKNVVSGFTLRGIDGHHNCIKELSRYIGVERATSSVRSFAMAHAFSYFWFWITGIMVYVCLDVVGLFPFPAVMRWLTALASLLCIGGIWFFIRSNRFRKACKAIRNRRAFLQSLLIEYFGRILQSFEVFFILMFLGFGADPSSVGNYLFVFIFAFLILVPTSLFANLLGFIPFQLGSREGGFILSVAAFGMTAELGLFIGIFSRMRDIIWTAIGLLMTRLFNHNE